jgi:hypothetical protein
MQRARFSESDSPADDERDIYAIVFIKPSGIRKVLPGNADVGLMVFAEFDEHAHANLSEE